MTAPLTARVIRTWRGVGGQHHAHALLEKNNSPITVSHTEPFREGERFEVERDGVGYVVKARREWPSQ